MAYTHHFLHVIWRLALFFTSSFCLQTVLFTFLFFSKQESMTSITSPVSVSHFVSGWLASSIMSMWHLRHWLKHHINHFLCHYYFTAELFHLRRNLLTSFNTLTPAKFNTQIQSRSGSLQGWGGAKFVNIF